MRSRRNCAALTGSASEAGRESPACAGWPVQAVARVRLSPAASRELFEKHLQTMPAVLVAWHVTGDVDYELRLACLDRAGLRAVLNELRSCSGGELASAGLVLGEVHGPGEPTAAEPRAPMTEKGQASP
jgi:Lrp/AsnC ligand binding domain